MRFVFTITAIGVAVIQFVAGYVLGYRNASLEMTPVHAYIQGQQDTLNDCREFGIVKIGENPFACQGEPTQ